MPDDQARLFVVYDEPENEPFEKQMVLGWIRGEYRVNITLENLTVPHMPGLDWIQLARDQWTTEQIDGLPTRVMMRRVAFFPQSAGTSLIPSMDQKLTIIDRDGVRSERVVRSKPVELTVRPPLGDPEAWWLPVSEIEYSDTWDKDTMWLENGETAIRTIVIRALGVTGDMLPPQPAMREPWLITFTAPPEKATELTPLGPLTTVIWSYSLRPKTGEAGVIPEVQIPYYRTTSGEAGNIILPATAFGYRAAPKEVTVSLWQQGLSHVWIVWPAFCAGFLLPLIDLAFVRVNRGAFRLPPVLKRLVPDRDALALRRAARRRDPAAFRRHASALIRRLGRGPSAAELLAPVDRSLFGTAQGDAQPDLDRLRRDIVRAVGG